MIILEGSGIPEMFQSYRLQKKVVPTLAKMLQVYFKIRMFGTTVKFDRAEITIPNVSESG